MDSVVGLIKKLFNLASTGSNKITSFVRNIGQVQDSTKPISGNNSKLYSTAIDQRKIDVYEINKTWGSESGKINGRKLKQAMLCASDKKNLQSQNINGILNEMFMPSKEESAINFYCDTPENVNKLVNAINNSLQNNKNSITLKIDLGNGTKSDLIINLDQLKHVLNLIDNNMPVFVNLDDRSIKVNPDDHYVQNFYVNSLT